MVLVFMDILKLDLTFEKLQQSVVGIWKLAN